MYVIKTFLDDSGSPDYPTHSFVTMGGYLADEYSWECFEKSWQAALDEAEIPYVHMREFGGDTRPFYVALKKDRIKHINFMLDAVQAIADNLHVCVHSTVKLSDLKQFNARHGLSIDAFSLAIYGCVCMIRRSFYSSETALDLIVDRFSKSESRVAEALSYAHSDTWHGLNVDKITPIPLQDEESFKNVLPLQAADFAAWEIRKRFEDRKGFSYEPADKALGREHMGQSYLKWVAEQEKQSGKPLRERKSYEALRKALGILPMGLLFDEFNLEQTLKCHPNGWST